MRAKVLATIAAIPALLAIKKILEALALIPVYTEGVRVAANGGDVTSYITAMVDVLLAIAPMGLIRVVAEGGELRLD